MTDFSAIFTHSEASPDPEVYPFDIPDLWRPSHLAPDLSLESPLFPIALLQETTKKIHEVPPRSKDTAEDSLFPFPADFNAPLGAWPGYEQPLSESIASSLIEEAGDTFSLNTNETLWAHPDACKPPEKPRFQTWDSFLVAGANEPVNPYFSEAGPRVFDAALSEYVNRREDVGDVIRSDVFCICLLHLGMGRSSVLFTYDRRKGEFRPVRKHLRISGCTAGTVESIVESFASTGNKIKILQAFIDDVYAGFNTVSPSVIALADCITSVLESLQQRLSIPPATIHSLLHLHSLIREPALIISTYHSIISATRSAHNDSELLTQLFAVVQQEQHRSGWLKPLLMETLARVSRPWLGFIEEWIGLDRPIGGEGIAEEGLAERGVFVRVEEEGLVDERGVEVVRRSFIFDKRRVPSFTSAESAESVFESGKSLRFLQKFHPNHPLSKPGAVEGVKAPRLEWKFSWEDLDNIQTQAKNYEKKLQSAIEKYAANGSIALDSGVVHHDRQEMFEEFPTFGKSTEELGAMIHHSASAMDQALPPLESSHNNDLLRHLVLSISRRSFSQTHDEKDHLTTFAPPISITPMLSFSYIFSVQAKLINTACLRMFFSEHKIRSHLTLLRRFQLFGNGVFASRLSHALFDDELDATERRTGGYRSGGTMGLKLGSRDSWPPASSELRLALMGVLTESFSESLGGREEAPHHRGGIHASGKEGELPGGLSFAVRDMTQEELERCMDPDGIEALDFLKLQYNPPSPLEAIITPTALYRYDRLFKLLLRVLRMLFVVNKLFRDARPPRPLRGKGGKIQPMTSQASCLGGFDPVAQKFRVEAHHFVSTICGYMFETGVGSTWKKFDEKLADIERKLCGDEEGLEGEGLERLRGYHESILDRIMFATLTRKRQAPVMKLVEDIFVAVLGFAKYSHEMASKKMGTMGEKELAELYKVFRRRVGIFISVCRGLSEKRGYGDGRRDLEGRRAVDAIFGTGYKEEGNLLGMLLLRLEMTGYYSESVGVGGGVKGK